MPVSVTPSLGVHVDSSNIQGQGAEGQQPCYYCSGQQCCPAAQGAEVDDGPVGKHHSEGSRIENLPLFGPTAYPTQLTP